ncbi:transport and Golgi organization protein 11 [Sitophilus oryzae]|uniref:Transport and Golgi organization protein 11 n=1 Tax=Sitophilus oryzae TaxID=7048 RepID=A0A6J2X754_SITOR|nr:transport and Golgi organization protein 11 [Sitophilus oryzae]XP_030746702.1 transport and Golgi organization protein 11 [Sitophilus oryzae]XP_030746703.1 transport and Golgi organization protein 11 [Sitophilus oryzae]XP_030746704.1 transport and Golgi organization protein 11 [Sitophilus oryzae]
MSANTSPSHYTEDAFVTDANFKVEINQKMKVPEKISFNNDLNGEVRNSWIKDNFDNMQVPERILVVGQDQHVGTRAPPREIAYDNSILSSDPYPAELPRVATPPRTLTLDKYPFPGIENYEQELEPEDHLPVIKPKSKVQLNLNDSVYSMTNSFRESTPPLGGTGDGLTTAEEVIHLRRQLAKLNRRVMALELENISRVQKEKVLVGCGVAYFLLKLIIWMSKD